MVLILTVTMVVTPTMVKIIMARVETLTMLSMATTMELLALIKAMALTLVTLVMVITLPDTDSGNTGECAGIGNTGDGDDTDNGNTD